MQLSISGKQTDVGDALRSHVEVGLNGTVEKYFDRAIEAHVVFSKAGPSIRSDISVHVGRGIILQGHAEAGDHYAAFDAASDHIAKRLRRYKSRIRDHHRNQDGEGRQVAQQYVLSAEADDAEPEPVNGDNPIVIAESSTEIVTSSVSEAVMLMDLANAPAMMFRNRAHGGLNMIYRRADGNVGWVDPRGNREKTQDAS